MKKEIVIPYLSNLINSLRDVGYTFEIAIADILDNSIDANAKNIKLDIEINPKPKIVIYDDGIGMSEKELIEAMRLASKDPKENRGEKVLGKFGLGLKTASFSQCKKLTVISKKDEIINIKQWDLNFIETENEWYLLTPPKENYEGVTYYKEFDEGSSGTLVILEEIDRYEKDEYTDLISSLKDHLSITFHRFLEGKVRGKKISIKLNEIEIMGFNPFNVDNFTTQILGEEKLKVYDETIIVKPYILPHHSNVSQQEYEKYGTKEGYTKAQGFYVYRSNRLLIHGTWLGLHKISDAHKLVRVQIEIPNSQDEYWGIDIKKSTAKPVKIIRKELKRIIKNVTVKGSRPFTGRGKRKIDKSTERFWDLIHSNEGIKFGLKKTHPLYTELISGMEEKKVKILELYLSGLESYLPLSAIQAQLNENPHKIKQIEEDELEKKLRVLEELGLSTKLIESLKKTELAKLKERR